MGSWNQLSGCYSSHHDVSLGKTHRWGQIRLTCAQHHSNSSANQGLSIFVEPGNQTALMSLFSPFHSVMTFSRVHASPLMIGIQAVALRNQDRQLRAPWARYDDRKAMCPNDKYTRLAVKLGCS